MQTSERIHFEAVVVDLHCDTLQDLQAGKRTLVPSGPQEGHIDLPRLKAGGVDVQVFALYIAPEMAGRGYQRAVELIEAFHREIQRNREAIGHARTVEEIESLLQQGKVAAVLAVENGDALEGRVENLDHLYAQGVRMLSLTWNHANALADGAREQVHGGLTPLGKDVIERMDELGMVLDVSHLSEQAFWQALEVAKGPVVATHSNAAALAPHPRNLTDEQLRAIAARGGVVGVNFYPEFLGRGDATVESVLEHITYMARVMGVDHVALGSDFDGISKTPAGLEDVSKVPAITRGLLARGYTEEEVKKILGRNALRVFREVWRH
ncbi:MAG: dipeptidase [Armatimonadota bacterium]|nr:dipeptidase [Armatimonadota bacterium]MDR5704067.1 dipeptidase [Armatimonadota bacterium]